MELSDFSRGLIMASALITFDKHLNSTFNIKKKKFKESEMIL